jgi:hypothetical protein
LFTLALFSADLFFSARAVEVLRETPNAELVFIGDEQRLWQFLDRAP